MLHLFALYLLAQFRETRALPLIDRLFRNPEYEALTGEVVTEDLGRLLASTCGENLAPIHALIEDPALDEWVRSAALRAMGVLLFTGGQSREEISAYYGTLFTGKLERKPSFLWNALISACTDFGMSEHLEAIRAAYAEGLCDPWVDRLEDVEIEICLPSANSERVQWIRYQLIDNAIAEMHNWFCFKSPPVRASDLNDAEPATPVKREHPKIGRNDPCPCLSGKKYKKCCGADV
jgi:hypothetical protein